MERLVFRDRTTHQAIRIARAGGMPATAHIQGNYQRLMRVGQYGKYGGIVLTGVGLAASCAQIAHARDRQEKNEIFVETLTSTAVSTFGGIVVGVFLISSPVGWGTAIVLAAGTVAWSYVAGKGLKVAYDRFGNKVDLIAGTGIDRVCRP